MVEMESEQKDLKDIVKDLLMIGQKLQTTIDKQAIDIRTLRGLYSNHYRISTCILVKDINTDSNPNSS